MIQEEESKQGEEQQKEEKSRGSQDDPTEDENGRVLFVTRYGEVYHLQEDCRNTKGMRSTRNTHAKTAQGGRVKY